MVNAALSVLLLGAGSAAVSAMPTTRDSCTFTSASDAKENKKDCSNIILKGITVPAGETLDLSNLKDGTKVTFEGTTTFEYEEWKGPLIRFSGTDIHITGAEGHLIDGNGAKWWDGKGTNGGKDKPKFFYAHDMTDSTIKGLNVKNTPVQGFSVNEAQNVQLIDITIDNTDGDVEDGGHNTDAFDVGDSTGVYISGANIKNQDDCLAINSGTDVSFTGATCSGGHGISIGSVGGRDNNKVDGVVISDCTVQDSDNGVRIKTVSDETGSVNNITYSDITLKNIAKYGIVIEQDYKNGGPTGEPTDGIPITDVTLDGVTGSVSDDAQAIYILCAACSDWSWSGVDISGGEQEKECKGVPSSASC